MSFKRTAEKELNADNWDDVEEPEDSGRFKVASEEALQKRVIRTAKRRTNFQSSDEPQKGIFQGFGGFNKTPASSSASPFGFLSSLNGKTETPKTTQTSATPTSTTAPMLTTTPLVTTTLMSITMPKTVLEKKPDEVKPKENNNIPLEKEIPKSASCNHDEYCANLKSLNLAVCEWIKSHIDKNPYCLLTPIFDDYKKYLKEFDKFKTECVSKPETKITTSGNPVPVAKSEDIFSNKNSVISPPSVPKKLSATETPSSLFAGVLPKTSESNEVNASLLNPSPAKNFFMQNYASSTPVTAAQSAPTFSFGQKTIDSKNNMSNFSFGTGKPFSFSSNIAQEENKLAQKVPEEVEEDDEPPKVSFTPVVEDGSIYSKRCKVFVKKDSSYGDRGVGTLYLKPIANSEKYQMIVRADNSLGNLLLNVVLSEAIPTQRMGKNNVMLICIPTTDATPPPVSTLLRVKTPEEADELLATLEKYKK